MSEESAKMIKHLKHVLAASLVLVEKIDAGKPYSHSEVHYLAERLRATIAEAAQFEQTETKLSYDQT